MLLILALVGCTSPAPPPAGTMRFVRDGVVVQDVPVQGEPLGQYGTLVPRSWSPGESVEIAGLTDVAPTRAECLPLFHVPLGDVSRLVAMGAPSPDTALAWSPDGRRLAIGSFLGDVLIVDATSGEVMARRNLAESMVKWVRWAADGQTLYVAEQSPDALVQALELDLSTRWSLRLADRVGQSTPPPGDDLYGVYSLPAAYGLEVLPSGELLVTATHGWAGADGARLNLSQLLRVSAEGQVLGAWPPAPVSATFKHPRVDHEGGLLALPINRSADGPPPADLPVHGVQVLEVDSFAPVAALVQPPLEPWFRHAFVWEAVDVSRVHDAVLMGLGDGRVRLFGLDGALRTSLDAGTPVLSGDVPIAAGVGHGELIGAEMAFLTSTTNIPWGAASPELRPPTVHPHENALWVYDLHGTLRWTWTGPQALEGLTRQDGDGTDLVVGAGGRSSDHRTDLFGALVFDASAGPQGGEARLRSFCATEGPVFFRQALSLTDRLAVSEFPFKTEDGAIAGTYQVTVFR